jgi:thiol-disulfide isomerase/thioredoxin
MGAVSRVLTGERLRLLSVVAIVIVFGATMTSCVGRSAAKPTANGSSVASVERVGVTRFAPDHRQQVAAFTGTTLDGKHISLADFAGDVVVINVWASWCEPCRAESPVLAAMSRQLRTPRVQFLGIDEEDVRSAAVKFVASVGATYPMIADPNGSVLARLRFLPANGIPSTLVVDRHGRMAAKVIGPITASDVTTLVNGAAGD